MSFDGTPGHLEFFADFRVVTTLKQQIGNLLLAGCKPNRLICHVKSPIPDKPRQILMRSTIAEGKHLHVGGEQECPLP